MPATSPEIGDDVLQLAGDQPLVLMMSTAACFAAAPGASGRRFAARSLRPVQDRCDIAVGEAENGVQRRHLPLFLGEAQQVRMEPAGDRRGQRGSALRRCERLR